MRIGKKVQKDDKTGFEKGREIDDFKMKYRKKRY